MVFKLKHGFHLFGWCKTEKQKLAKYKLMQTSSSCMSVTGMNHIFTPHHTQRFAPLLIITSPSLVNVPWIRAISFTGPSVWNNLPFPEQHGRTLFSSGWYLCAWKSPYALHPVSQKFPQCCL